MNQSLSKSALRSGVVAVSFDAKRLREENIRLQEELAQCQVDKEFVWSLWKKLQVASPDITEAVALVVEREKQKQEEKDCKVLEILKLKDQKIGELQVLIDEQTRELAFLTRKKMDVHDEIAKLQTENAVLMDELTDAQRQLNAQKDGRNEDIITLHSSLDELADTCKRLQEENANCRNEKEDLYAKFFKQEEELKTIQLTNNHLQESHDNIHAKEQKLSKIITKYENELKKCSKKMKARGDELEAVRKELSDLWSTHQQCDVNAKQMKAIIAQLEQLQRNTESVLKANEEAHANNLEQQQKVYRSMSEEIALLRNAEILLKDQVIDLQDQLRCARKDHDYHASIEDEDRRGDVDQIITAHNVTKEKWRTHMYRIEKENEQLREKIQEKNRVIDRLSKRSACDDYVLSRPDDDKNRQFGHQASRFESGIPLREADLLKKLRLCEGKLEEAERKVQIKESQLTALRQVHKRRLTRLKNLLTSYRLVREQLKIAEDELGRPPKKRQLKLYRSKPKDLQKEDAKAAWNELRCIKHENKNLTVLKMNLEEQLDDMNVKASEDAAVIHELRIELGQMQEEQRFLRKQQRSLSSTPRKRDHEEIESLRAKVETNDAVIKNLQARMREVSTDNTVLVEEKRSLKFDVNSLKKALCERKNKLADLKAEISRLQRAARRARPVTKAAKISVTTPVAQHYQKTLSQSVHKINARFSPHARLSQSFGGRQEQWSGDQLLRRSTGQRKRRSDRSIQTMSLPGEQAQSEEDVDWLSEHSDFESVTCSELAGPTSSGTSLGEVIARKANFVDAEVQTISKGQRQLRKRIFHSRRSLLEKNLAGGDSPANSKLKCDMGTSPLPWRPLKRYHCNHRAAAYLQVSSLKHRLVSLQLQTKALTEAKLKATATAENRTKEMEELRVKLSSANSKLTSAKASNEAIQTALDTLQKMNEQLEAAALESVPRLNAEQERKSLENKIKGDIARQAITIKELKRENDTLKEKNTELNDKVARLERDIAQKRTLLEDMKLKVRLAKDNAKTDFQQLEEKSDEVNRIRAIMEQNKTTLDSVKTSVRALTKEKKEQENKCKQSSEELAKKTRQLTTCQAQCKSLQSELDDLQDNARQQMLAVAAQGESAVTFAQERLTKSHTTVQQFELFIKHLANILVGRENQYRIARQRLVRQKKLDEKLKSQTESLKKAKRRAQEILNLSASDVEDLLCSSAESGSENESFSDYWDRENEKWYKKCEKVLSKEEFAGKLAELFITKIDDVSSLL